eukprot:TRINITY_DN76386_c0_g1_i1.p1 TRINITY_DN76386_c0_g1~~TRINITY_DN76386_c0_g1_i1.p1  ORF type:complete len:184 (+),score=35.75 TRINITY_DN76386_c0_g1_i1:61-612(+)
MLSPDSVLFSARGCRKKSIVEEALTSFVKALPQALLEELRPKVDFLEVEGELPLTVASSEWSGGLVGPDGILCDTAPLFYDKENRHGEYELRSDASGTIVVFRRGTSTFEAMARRAEEAGAVGIVVVDNADAWDHDVVMSMEGDWWSRIGKSPPTIPAVLVRKAAKEFLCYGRRGLKARIVRR